MKKRRKGRNTSKKKAVIAAPVARTRRSILKKLPYLAGAIIAVGGVGYAGVNIVLADLAEQDLSIVGSGTPVIVQIHNPSCPICLALQKETRAALDMMEENALDYRVANITSTTGLAFANSHGSSHATLLFFDGSGQILQRVHGATDRDVLFDAFMAHVAAHDQNNS